MMTVDQTKANTSSISDEVIDMLLDQEGFECDPISRIEGDTPLHSAIRYINNLPSTPETAEFSSQLIGMMIEAGSDPRIKNKARLTPYDLTDPSNRAIRTQLQDAVDIAHHQGDYIIHHTGAHRDLAEHTEEEEDLPDDYAGSASDSDFDPEEYKRERERQKAAERKQLANGGGEAGGKI